MNTLWAVLAGVALAALGGLLWFRRRSKVKSDVQRALRATSERARVLNEAAEDAIRTYDLDAERRSNDGSSLADTLESLGARRAK